MAWIYFIVLPGQHLQDNPYLTLAFGLGKFVQFSFPLIFVAIVNFKELRPSRPTWHGMRAGLAFGVATGLAILALYFFGLRGSEMFLTAGHKANEWIAQQKLNSTSGFLMIAGFVCFLHCPLEEYYWRWFVFGRLRRHIPWG
jgi:membrane protease YdiL (CAAX protease family)